MLTPYLVALFCSCIVCFLISANLKESPRKNRLDVAFVLPLFFTLWTLAGFQDDLNLWLQRDAYREGMLEVRSVEYYPGGGRGRPSRCFARGAIDGKPRVARLRPVPWPHTQEALALQFPAGCQVRVFYKPWPEDPLDDLNAVQASMMQDAPTYSAVVVVIVALIWLGAIAYARRRLAPGEHFLEVYFFFLFRPDSSKAWPLRPPFEPVLDLRTWTISGVAMGEPEDHLHRLGRPDNRRPRANHRYAYYKSGTSIGVGNGEVEDVRLALRAVASAPGLEGARGHLVGPDGRVLDLSSQTTLREVEDLLGPPARQQQDAPDAADAEIVYYYKYDGHGLDVEALPDGRVKCISAYANE